MTAYEKAELAGRIELASKRLLDTAKRQDWQEFDRQWHLTAKLRSQAEANCQDRTLGTATLAEVADKSDKTASNVTISVEKDNLAIIVHPEGMGTWDGPYAPVLLERHEGKMRLLVWANINQQDPTHIIDLSGALESNRRSQGS